MYRKPPSGNQSLFSDSIYRIDKLDGTAGSTYYIDGISRVPVKVVGYSGKFVRYGGSFRRLHPAKELNSFIAHAKQEGSIIVLNGQKYRSSKHGAKDFILEYEKSIGPY